MMQGVRSLLRRLGISLGSGPWPAAILPVTSLQEAGLAHAPLDVLAAKVMFSYLRNRQQLLGPPPTAFGQLDESQTELLIRATIAAVHASGPFDEMKERQLRGALSSFGLQVEARGFIADAIKRPVPLDVLLRSVRDPHIASLFYAASLATADKHDEVNRAYLNYLASRLKLPQDTLLRLHSQFGFKATPAA